MMKNKHQPVCSSVSSVCFILQGLWEELQWTWISVWKKQICQMNMISYFFLMFVFFFTNFSHLSIMY